MSFFSKIKEFICGKNEDTEFDLGVNKCLDTMGETIKTMGRAVSMQARLQEKMMQYMSTPEEFETYKQFKKRMENKKSE